MNDKLLKFGVVVPKGFTVRDACTQRKCVYTTLTILYETCENIQNNRIKEQRSQFGKIKLRIYVKIAMFHFC